MITGAISRPCHHRRHCPPPHARQRFRRQLLTWYRKHGRDLPWRKTDDPYHILVSEIMLQQTQVDRVLPKYHEWLAKYPSFEALAAAPADEVSQDVVPARLQHSAATAAVDRARGRRPLRRRAALGRGDAAVVQRHRRSTPQGAIRSFAFRERAAILDTNVARVLLRVFIGGGDAKAPSHAPPALAAVRRRWYPTATSSTSTRR